MGFVTMKVKAMQAGFFDRKAVLDAVDRATIKIFKMFGANVRKRALASMKTADGPSAPGQPPHTHLGVKVKKTSKRTGKTRVRSVSFLREFLWFAYDKENQSVVIGPARLNSTVDPRATAALEYGGPSTIIDHGKRKQVSIKARPFMHPAAQAEQAGLPAMWRDSVR